MYINILTVLLCITGILSISYGMYSKNNFVFIFGLLFIMGGYLLVSKRLKGSASNKPLEKEDWAMAEEVFIYGKPG